MAVSRKAILAVVELLRDGCTREEAIAALEKLAGPEKVTWLTPFWDAWKAAYGGELPVSHYSKQLKRLLDANGEAEVLRAWKAFLAGTPHTYASPTKFFGCYGVWAGRVRPPETHPAPEPQEDPQRAATRLWLAERAREREANKKSWDAVKAREAAEAAKAAEVTK